MFYSQADDVRQLDLLGSLHFVLVLAQMSKPENTHTHKHAQWKTFLQNEPTL